MAQICQCCGQPIKLAAKPRATARTFKGYDDFHAAFLAAQAAVCAELGERWKLIRGASVYARVPRAWVAVKTAYANLPGHRDMRLPAAKYWPAGELPAGPEYAAEYAWEDTTGGADAAVVALRREHAAAIRTIREQRAMEIQPWGVNSIWRRQSVLGLAAAAEKRVAFGRARKALAMATVLALAACGLPNYVPAHGQPAEQLAGDRLGCKMLAEGMTPPAPGSFVGAAGKPAFVGAVMGAYAIGLAIQAAAEQQHKVDLYSDCMEAHGYQRAATK